MADPRYDLSDTKGLSKARKTWRSGLKTKVLGGAAIALGITVTAKLVDEIVKYLKERNLKAKSTKYYAQMLDAHPELKKEKPAVVARYWASLYHFAPYMAQDPLAAGAFIRQSIARGLPEEFGGPAPDTYKTLTDINEGVMKTTQPGSGKDGIGGTVQNAFASSVIKDYMENFPVEPI